MKTYLEKDPNKTTDTGRNLFFLYLWLFFGDDIFTLDNVAQKLPVNFEMYGLPYKITINMSASSIYVRECIFFQARSFISKWNSLFQNTWIATHIIFRTHEVQYTSSAVHFFFQKPTKLCLLKNAYW